MISVIIPTHNRARLLPRAMQSVLDQTFSDIELIIVDDASTDDTAQVIASMTDSRIRYIRLDRNSGACTARNTGVQAARGEWIAFQDSDDEWLPHKLATQFALLQATGADVIFCAFERCTADGTVRRVFPHESTEPGRITYEQLLYENLVSTQTILGKKACFEQVPFKPDFPRMQDWELMLRMVQQYNVHYASDVLVRMYEQPDSISRHPEKGLAALEALHRMHRAAIERDPHLTLRMCIALSEARRACNLPDWTPFFQHLSPRYGFSFNLRMILRALKRMMKHMTRRRS